MSIKEMLTQFDNIKAEHNQAIKAIDSLTERAEQMLFELQIRNGGRTDASN